MSASRPPASRVVVTDGENRVALAVVRALGAAGRPAHVLAAGPEERRPPAARSRWCVSWEIARADGAGRGSPAAGDVLLPVSTPSVLRAAEQRDELAARGVRLLVPDADTVRSAIRKDELARRAAEAGLPTPRTAGCASEAAARAVLGMTPPWVLKLRDDEGLDLPPAARYRIATTPRAAEEAARALGRRHPRLVVQEYLSGEGGGVTAVARGGELVGAVAHIRIRELPPSGGPSACAETTGDGELMALARRTAQLLRWDGPVMVEAKRREPGGPWMLLEVNPRFGGSLPLALAAGVNLPDLAVRLALGEQPRDAPAARPGVRMRFLPMDVMAVAQAVATGVRRRRYLSTFLRDLMNGRIREGLFDPSDPAPGRAIVAEGIRRSARRLLGGDGGPSFDGRSLA